MKFLILSLTAVLGTIGIFKFTKYNHLDITGDQFDITRDEIEEDLWR